MTEQLGLQYAYNKGKHAQVFGHWLSLHTCLMTLHAWLPEISEAFVFVCPQVLPGCCPFCWVWPQGPSQDTPVGRGLLNTL